MSFGAIGNGYENIQHSYTTTTRTSASSFSTHRQMMLPENRTAPETLGIGFLDVGGGVSYGLSASYAANSTVENPVIKVSVTKGKGDVETYEVNINDINAGNATGIEMFALCNYADDIGKGTSSTFGSWQTLKNFGYNAEYLGDFHLSKTLQEFITVKQNWSKMVASMTNTYLQAGVYKQVLDGNSLKDMFGLCTHSDGKTANAESLEDLDYRKFISDMKNILYEKIKNNDTKVSFQTGAQSFTEEEWDKLLNEVDDITEEMREAMRERHQKRFEELMEEKRVEATEGSMNTDIASRVAGEAGAKPEWSDFKEYETKNYQFIPEPGIGGGGLRILINGESAGVFSTDDLKIRVDEQTGTRVLISDISGFGNSWYDAIPVTEELEKGLSEAMGVEDVPEVILTGYYIGTHAATGIQYVMRPGDEGRGGKVLLRNEADVARYNALAEEYYTRYPNLVTSQEFGRIYASFEICGMAERTATGIVKIGYDNISYNDNFDDKKNWSIMLTGNTWELLSEWLKENRSRMKELPEFRSWMDILDKIGGSYERVWSDEELRQGYLNN